MLTQLRGPLAGRYPAAAAMVMSALIPYLALSAAIGPITPIIAHYLHMSLQDMSLASGMGNAAYAAGTVLAVQFAQLLHQRRMMVLYVVLLVIGSVLEAAAQDPAMFIAGHVLQGLCTSLLLIAAVPPLALGFGVERLRETAVIMSMCIFGAVALGPLVGGLQASAHAWRPLFWVVAAISATAFVLSLLTFEDTPPFDRGAPRAPGTIVLAAAGPVAAFWGASELLSHRFMEFQTFGLLAVGLGLIVVLIVHQYRSGSPLLTIRRMLTSTIPVAGIVLALFAAAASVSATALTASLLTGRYSAVHIGLLYLPELAGAVLTAVLLGVAINKRWMQGLPLLGMGFLAAGIAVFLIHVPSTQTTTLVGSGLTGIGLGATVAPALVRRRLLAALQQPPTRVRDRRAAARGGRLHDRARVRAPRAHGRRQPADRHDHRAVGRAGHGPRRRRDRGRDLPARGSAAADAATRAVHRPGRRGVGLAAAARRRPRPFARTGVQRGACPGDEQLPR